MNKMIEPTPGRPGGSGLDRMFGARSIAVVGASSDPAKIGGKPVAFLKKHFSGEIVPINPKRDEIAGLPCRSSIGAAGGPVDLAIIALPARFVRQSVHDCLAAGVRNIVLFSSGFGEIDEAGRAEQQKIAELCTEAGARLLGPNSLGFISFHEGIFATFSAALDNIWPAPGNVAIASQSGAVGTYLMALMAERGLGFSHFIATGNEADIDVADCIAWLAEDDRTDTILAYFEGCRDGQRLRDALELARRKRKPVIAIKPGATDSGQAAVQSHTGMLAGSKRVFDAVLEASGAHAAATMEEAVDITLACSPALFPRTARATVITPSGGVGIMLADDCSNAGISLPPVDGKTAREILSILPLASTLNPIDTTAQVSADFKLFGTVIGIVADAAAAPIHFIFMAHMGKTPAVADLLTPVLESIAEKHQDKLFVLIARASDEFRGRMEEKGFLVFEEPSRAVRAVRALLDFGTAFARPAAQDGPGLAAPLPPLAEIAANTVSALEMLDRLGIAAPACGLARDLGEAEEIAAGIGYPVVMKIESPDIQHKSDVGGVHVSIPDPEGLRQAWRRMMDAVQAARPLARINGCLISAMADSGVDTIIGLRRDPVFGHVVAFGIGGIFTEILDDVAIAPAPVSPEGALAMIERLRAGAIFDGARGLEPVDREALAQTIAAVSQLAAFYGDRLESLEINPYRATSKGGLALDILILPGPAPKKAGNP